MGGRTPLVLGPLVLHLDKVAQLGLVGLVETGEVGGVDLGGVHFLAAAAAGVVGVCVGRRRRASMLELLLVVKLLFGNSCRFGSRVEAGQWGASGGAGLPGGSFEVIGARGGCECCNLMAIRVDLRVGFLWGWVWFLIVSLLFWGVVGGTSLN